MNKILDIINLSKHYGGINVADDIDFSIPMQSIVGIYGDNGAGKTTFFNLISGFEHPDSGQIWMKNVNISNKSVLQRAQMGMGRLFQKPRLFSGVTVFDNLLAAANLSKGHHLLNYLFKYNQIIKEDFDNKQRASQILHQFSLGSKENLKAHELSVGERKLLSLGCLLMNGADFILLDELSSGLNRIMIDNLIIVLNDLNKSGITFLLIEHNKEFLKSVCNEVFLMQNGKILKS